MRRKTLGAVIAAFVLALIATASASAIGWKVEGKALGAGVKESTQENVPLVKSLILRKANGLTIECKRLKEKTGFVEGTSKAGAESLELSECAVTSSAKCAVEEPITTTAVTSTLEAGPPVKVKFVPKEGDLFTTATLKSKFGQTCAQAGKYHLTGSAVGEAPEAGTEKLGHLLNFTETSGSSLLFGEESSVFTGELQLELTSGKKWSAS
jgi:hypothetical protein